jgi:hypothetical protein
VRSIAGGEMRWMITQRDDALVNCHISAASATALMDDRSYIMRLTAWWSWTPYLLVLKRSSWSIDSSRRYARLGFERKWQKQDEWRKRGMRASSTVISAKALCALCRPTKDRSVTPYGVLLDLHNDPLCICKEQPAPKTRVSSFEIRHGPRASTVVVRSADLGLGLVISVMRI